MNTYEIEIKSLLGGQENANLFRQQLVARGALKESENTQLNHYFIHGDFGSLVEKLLPVLSEDEQVRLAAILKQGTSFSVRTRDTDGKVRFVVKASVDTTTSDNGIQRIEFEVVVPVTLDELDKILLASGFEYQAKWSRNRESYLLDDVAITLDRNAGYGYLSEFEITVDDESQLHEAEARVRELMDSFNLVELNQDRLARMFDYYNQNWRDYYGTDQVFTIE